MAVVDTVPVGLNSPDGSVTYDAAAWRRYQAGPLGHSDNAVVAAPGVLHGLQVTVDGSGVAWCGLGSGVVSPLPTTASAGSYRVDVHVSPSETLEAPDGTYDRRDIAYLRVSDPETTGGTVQQVEFVVDAGVPDATPVAPDVPDGALLLAEVLVPASGSPSVVDRRRFTGSVSVIPCTSDTDTYPVSGSWTRPGTMIFETDTALLKLWSGSSWQEVSGPDTGWVDVTVAAGFAALSGEGPEVRRIGPIVYARGGWDNTGIVASASNAVGSLPAGFVPPKNAPQRMATSGGGTDAVFFVTKTGDLQIRTNENVSSYYLSSGCTWLVN